MTRLLVDASGLIALAQVGELDVLRQLAGEVHATAEVLEEALSPEHPEGDAVRAAVAAGWIVVGTEASKEGSLASYGIGRGEASLFVAWRKGDVLLLDDLPARRLAEVRAIPRIGLLGLLVRGVEEGLLSPARGREVLDKQAASTFHMSVDLYQRARARMERA